MPARIIAAFIALLCGYACYRSARWAVADYAIRSNVHRALRLAPGNPDYYVRWARAEPAVALPALGRAATLDPADSSVWIELAAAAEQHGDLLNAEQCLLRAVGLDRTFAPRWLLAEYYARRHDQQLFWPAVRAALATSYDDSTPLFEVCWDLDPDPRVIRDRALPERPDIWRQYFDFLLSKNLLDAAEEISGRIMQHAGPDTVPSLLLYCDRLIEKNRVSQAVDTWNALAGKHLVDDAALAPSRGVSVTNGGFTKAVLGRAFDWRVSAPSEISYRQEISPSGLRFDFFGNQPEHCELLSQLVPVEPDKQYRLVAKYETEGLQGNTGIAWQMLDLNTNADLLRGIGRVAASQRRQNAQTYEFETPSEKRLVRLVLAYDRALGTVRIEGSLSLDSVALDFRP